MKLNQNVRYGVACIFEMAKFPGEYLGADHFVAKHNIPLAYTQKVLQHLVRAGLVASLKGRGYKLARPLSDIKVIDLISALRAESHLDRDNTEMGEILENRVNKLLGELALSQIEAGGKKL